MIRLLTVLLVCATAIAQTVCPGCVNNLPKPGFQSAGKWFPNVSVDSGWNSLGLASKVSAAMDDAVNAWNAQNTCFQVGETNGTGDIVIQPYNFSGTNYCGDNDATSYYYFPNNPQHIRLDIATTTNNTQAQVAYLIEHELGHSFGLTNAAGACATAGNPTIMGPADPSCAPYGPISSRDAAKVNQYCTNPSSCDRSRSQVNNVEGNATSCPTGASCADYGYSESDPCYYDNACNAPYYNLIQVGGDQCCYPTTPIIVDVSGRGFNLTNAHNGVMFDMTGTGVKVRVSWTATGSDNAFLVLDRNGNGVIDDARELFGNITPQPHSAHANGFLALAEFDKTENGGNNDGRIDEHDAVFSRLRLWQDVNHNGSSEPSELHPLGVFGIVGIDLKYTDSRWTDANKNWFRYKGEVETSLKGPKAERLAYDVLLIQEK